MTETEKSETEQIEFFQRCLDRFETAEASTESVQRCYRIAGTTVRLRFAGETMVSTITSALEHLRTADVSNPDLTVCIWDSESTGVQMLPPPCDRNCFTDRGDIWGFTSRRIKTAFHWVEYSLNLMDLERGIAVFWVQTIRSVPFWVHASPLRTIFHWWMEKNHHQLLHAAAIGTEDGAVLISGKGGVGKSTTALACLAAGLSYVADDYLIVTHDPVPAVFSLYCTAKLNADNLSTFPEFSPLIQNSEKLDREKAVMFLYPRMRDHIAEVLPLKAILTPAIVNQEETTISPIPYWTVQRAMAFTTMSQLPGVGRHTHTCINELCGKLPIFQIALGRSIRRIPAAIRNFLDSPESHAQAVTPVEEVAQHTPLVSVIIPVYNGERFIAAAIDHVRSQNYPAIELIVVDDGSQDRTADIVERSDSDIRFFRQENSGPAAARNRGLRDASGEFILFLDVDDFWPENTIQRLVSHMLQEPEMDVIRGYAQLVKVDHETGELTYDGNPKESFADYIGAAIYRRSVFGQVGLFDPTMLFGEDADWFTRAREQGIRMKRLEEVTLYVRRHGSNMTEGKNLVELNMLRIIKKALDRRRAGVNGLRK